MNIVKSGMTTSESNDPTFVSQPCVKTVDSDFLMVLCADTDEAYHWAKEINECAKRIHPKAVLAALELVAPDKKLLCTHGWLGFEEIAQRIEPYFQMTPLNIAIMTEQEAEEIVAAINKKFNWT